jgi:hypothetical protein
MQLNIEYATAPGVNHPGRRHHGITPVQLDQFARMVTPPCGAVMVMALE